jgi:hypothetical protein
LAPRDSLLCSALQEKRRTIATDVCLYRKEIYSGLRLDSAEAGTEMKIETELQDQLDMTFNSNLS